MPSPIITWKQAEQCAYQAVLENHETWMPPGRISIHIENETFKAYKEYMRRLLPVVLDPECEERIVLSAKLMLVEERTKYGTGYETDIIEAHLTKYRDDPSTIDYIMERCPRTLIDQLKTKGDSPYFGQCITEWTERLLSQQVIV